MYDVHVVVHEPAFGVACTLFETNTMIHEPPTELPRLTFEQSFAALIAFLREYGGLMADKEGVGKLLARVDPDSSGRPTTIVRREWRQAIRIAVEEPHVRRRHPLTRIELTNDDLDHLEEVSPDPTCSPREAFDAMIRILEHLEPEFPMASALLGETYYSEAYRDGDLNTASPYTWWDWLSCVRVAADH